MSKISDRAKYVDACLLEAARMMNKIQPAEAALRLGLTAMEMVDCAGIAARQIEALVAERGARRKK